MQQIPVKGRILDIISGESLDAEIRVNPPEAFVISGRVIDGSGKPMRDIGVDSFIPHGRHWWTQTGDNGEFYLDGLDGIGASLLTLYFNGVSGALTMHTLQKVNTVSRGALCGVQVVGGLLSRHIIGHYADALKTVRERGFYEMLGESSAPYIAAVWDNFAVGRETWTEQLVNGKAITRAYETLTGWLGRRKPATEPGRPGPEN